MVVVVTDAWQLVETGPVEEAKVANHAGHGPHCCEGVGEADYDKAIARVVVVADEAVG